MLALDQLTRPDLEILSDHSVHRRLTVKPAMCGHNSLFVGQIGDWTWETVSLLCDTNVFAARDASGAPTYLSFYYYHIKASPRLHLRSFSFGDEIDVVSSAFNFGSESILTLHKIRLASDTPTEAQPIQPEEFYDHPSDSCLYIENFNRWITRSQEKSNQDLVKSSPTGFRYAHLPTLPDRYSPRLAYNYARTAQTFHDLQSPEYALTADEFSIDYPIDITRDINGVGLIYFASYFSIIDWALLRFWQHLGRSNVSFLEKIVLDHKLCYLGNADIDSVLTITLRSWRKVRQPGYEVFNAVIHDRSTQRVIAVSTLHTLSEQEYGICY